MTSRDREKTTYLKEGAGVITTSKNLSSLILASEGSEGRLQPTDGGSQLSLLDSNGGQPSPPCYFDQTTTPEAPSKHRPLQLSRNCRRRWCCSCWCRERQGREEEQPTLTVGAWGSCAEMARSPYSISVCSAGVSALSATAAAAVWEKQNFHLLLGLFLQDGLISPMGLWSHGPSIILWVSHLFPISCTCKQLQLRQNAYSTTVDPPSRA